MQDTDKEPRCLHLLLEALIFSVCLQNAFYTSQSDGCPSALQAYYLGHSELQKKAKYYEREIRSAPYGNFTLNYLVAPGYTAFAAKRARIRLSTHWALDYNFQDKVGMLAYGFSF